MHYLYLCLSAIFYAGMATAQYSVIASNSVWSYFDGGNTPLQWNQLAFDASSWSVGNAELGYGDGDESTVVSYGSDSENKHITTYFRREFSIINPQQYSHLTINLLRDDGAVVYINGQEVWRSNMPSGPISPSTEANNTVAWPNEDDWHTMNVSAAYLENGTNVIAVEVHQDSPSSSDISFNLSMVAHDQLNAAIVRGPYLQKATQQSVIVRWRTDVPTDTKVQYGISPNVLSSEVSSPVFTTEHQVEITGLASNTTYYYSIGSQSDVLAEGTNHYFETLPPIGEEATYRFVALGDAGTGSQSQLDAKTAIINAYGHHFDGVLLLGDNAYQSGFDNEYQDYFFDNIYNEIFENTIIWPAPGNHDYNHNLPFSPSPAYFDIFNCPTNGESGGVASGTEKYYSYTIGNVHFISLDSYDEPRSASAAMATWLQQDLQANEQPWVIAYWHHPPYTKGSHDSDDPFLDGELVEMRENILPILETYGVDLVLNGHSHCYERSHFINGHYGFSETFNANHIKSPGSGDYPQECPYGSGMVNGEVVNGAVYAVVGCSGKVSDVDGDWPHPVMYSYTNEEIGGMIVEVTGNRLDARFLTNGGVEYDHFSIVHRASETHEKEVCISDPLVLEKTWNSEQAVWMPGNVVSDTYTTQANSNATVTVTDELGCFVDTFQVAVLQNDTCGYLFIQEQQLQDLYTISYHQGKLVVFSSELTQNARFNLTDVSGKLVHSFVMSGAKHEEPVNLKVNELYVLFAEDQSASFKFIVYE